MNVLDVQGVILGLLGVALSVTALVINLRRYKRQRAGEPTAPAKPWPNPSLRLPTTWRIALPGAWAAMFVMAVAFAEGSSDLSYYTVTDNIAFTVVLAALIGVPALAGAGWRWSPIFSVVGAICGLVVSYADARRPGEGGPIELLVFSGVLTVSLLAVLDKRVRALLRQP